MSDSEVPPATAAAAASGRGPEQDERPRPRERILVAAGVLFGRSGVRAVGVDTIITTAQVAKASLYHHFPSKDDLVVAWLRSEPPRWIDRVTAATAAKGGAAVDRLLGFFDAVAVEIERPDFHGCPYLNTAAEFHDGPGSVRAVVVDYLEEVEAHLCGLATDAGSRDPGGLGAELRLLVAGAMASSQGLGRPSGADGAARVARVLIEEACGPRP